MRRLCDYNPLFTYFMNFNNMLYEFQITNLAEINKKIILAIPSTN